MDVLDVKASAGPGTLVTSDFIETIRAIEYTNEQARALFGNRPATHVKVITVNGDSMDGTISLEIRSSLIPALRILMVTGYMSSSSAKHCMLSDFRCSVTVWQ